MRFPDERAQGQEVLFRCLPFKIPQQDSQWQSEHNKAHAERHGQESRNSGQNAGLGMPVGRYGQPYFRRIQTRIHNRPAEIAGRSYGMPMFRHQILHNRKENLQYFENRPVGTGFLETVLRQFLYRGSSCTSDRCRKDRDHFYLSFSQP